MSVQIFKVGDKVYHYAYGWGEVMDIEGGSSVKVDFNRHLIWLSKTDINLLSFTEYTLPGFSQERPIDWSEHVGKWCKFWDEGHKHFVTDRLEYIKGTGAFFYSREGLVSVNCEPLNEEQLKAFGLTND